MKIRSIFFVLLVCFSISLAAQTSLQVQGMSPNLYLIHTVVSKENWYSIGRLYNLSPKELAPFNQLTLDNTLAIGQQLRIPLKPTNFSQDNHKAADEVFVPVYYQVQEREWMYRISQNHNKVSIERLEQWNNVSNGDVKPGMELIVGFLKVKPAQSALASQSSSIRTAQPTVKVTQQSPLSTNEPVVVNKPEEKKSVEPKVKIEDLKKETAKTNGSRTEEKPIAEKQEPRRVEQESKPVENKPMDTKPILASNPVNYVGGYFKTQYGETGKGTTGSAGVFRSTSGWQDGKYYALMNNIPVGTIIKVANPSNGKTVYAKVLGNLPDMKESLGLTLRLSDAAATELGLASNKFPVNVRY